VGQGTARRAQSPAPQAIARVRDRDYLRWEPFVELRCGHLRLQADLELCREELEMDANQVYAAYRDRGLASQRALAGLLNGLRSVEGPKTVILISEGLATERPWETQDLAAAPPRPR